MGASQNKISKGVSKKCPLKSSIFRSPIGTPLAELDVSSDLFVQVPCTNAALNCATNMCHLKRRRRARPGQRAHAGPSLGIRRTRQICLHPVRTGSTASTVNSRFLPPSKVISRPLPIPRNPVVVPALASCVLQLIP